MLRRLPLISAVLFMAQPTHAAEKLPVSLPRTTKWEINYDKEACHLLAKFGSGREETLIRLTRYQPGDSFDLTLLGQLFDTREPSKLLEIGFGLGPSLKRQAVTGTASNGVPLLLLGSLRLDRQIGAAPQRPTPAITPEQEAAATAINLGLSGGKRYRLETGSFAGPMGAMRKCVDDLVASWGFDPAQQAGLLTPPVPLNSPASWMGSNDYPESSTRRGENGIVQFRLNIGQDGAIEGCHVLYRTNPDEFADLTCKLIQKRAKFQPARDANGNPTRSFFVSKVRWMVRR